MEKEIWKDIIDFEGCYQISSLGRIRSLDRFVTCRNGGVKLFKGKIKNVSENRRRYKSICLSKNSKTKNFDIHRLLAIHFIPNPGNKKEVNHIDGNRMNNDLSNLEWSTPSENALHAHKTGLISNTGRKNHKRARKLTDNQVIDIKKNYKRGMAKILSQKYNVSKECIYSIWGGYSWGDIHIKQ